MAVVWAAALLSWAQPSSAQMAICVQVGDGRTETRPRWFVPREEVVSALRAIGEVYVIGAPGSRCPGDVVFFRLDWVVGPRDETGRSRITVTLDSIEASPMTLVAMGPTVGPGAVATVAHAIARLIERDRTAIEARFQGDGSRRTRSLRSLVTPLRCASPAHRGQ